MRDLSSEMQRNARTDLDMHAARQGSCSHPSLVRYDARPAQCVSATRVNSGSPPVAFMKSAWLISGSIARGNFRLSKGDYVEDGLTSWLENDTASPSSGDCPA